MKNKLLLISNSTNAGEEYLSWPRNFISQFLEKHGIKNLLFIPYAGVNLSPESITASFNVYEDRVRKVFDELGFTLRSIHLEKDPVKAIRDSESVVVGGGNTFHLVKMMHETGIMKATREKVLSGVPFIGWSAGANVACPTMKTTNDMPISEPPSFDCLDLVPFQINPHYLDANPAGHGGETREQRLMEFMMVNRKVFVAGLREATLIEVEDDRIELRGSRPMRVFRFGEQPREIQPGEDIGFLLGK
jgi:dipeptidase E